MSTPALPALTRETTDAVPKSPHWRILHAIADRAAPALARALEEIFVTARERASVSAIEREIAAGRPGPAATLAVDAWRSVLSSLRAVLGRTMRDVLDQAGDASVTALPPGALTVRKASPAVAFDFDVTNPSALQWIATETGLRVTEIDTETVAAIRAIIDTAFQEGLPPRQSAVLIRETIGLTSRQAEALARFRAALETRALEGAELTADMTERLRQARALGLYRSGDLDAAVLRLRDRMIRQRALVIARTETITASAGGQNLLWRQATEEGRLDPARWEVKWILTPDDRTCERCKSQVRNYPRREIDGVYENGVARPTLHPSCLPGDVRVFSPSAIRAATARDYQGDIVILRTAGGQQLVSTPNHPVWTDHGWLPAREVLGREVYRQVEGIPEAISPLRSVLVRQAESVERGNTEAADLHGDGGGEVEIAWMPPREKPTCAPIVASIDRVVSLSAWLFRGRVYNLECADGAYFAGGLLTHNCRCAEGIVRKPDVAPALRLV